MAKTDATISARELNRATLARQMLLEREVTSPVAAVERLIGMQAQEARPPYIGLWSRVRDSSREEMVATFADRRLVRATLMRGTIHAFSAADYRAFRPAIQPVLDRSLSALGERSAGLDLDRVLDAARTMLATGPLPFTEIRDRLQAQFPAVNDRALGYTVRLSIPLVVMPSDHRWGFAANAPFGLADDWIGACETRHDALPGLMHRYLAAFGPATVADAQTWFGMTGLKPAFESLRPELMTFRGERGKEYFDLPDAPRPPADIPAPVRFLPDFDNLLLSHGDRTRVIADDHRNIVYQKGNLRLLPTILVDGVVAGMWRSERVRKEATLTVTLFSPLTTATRRELADEAEGLIRFIEDDATSHNVTVADSLATS